MISERDLAIALVAFFAGGAAFSRELRGPLLIALAFGALAWLVQLLP